jgi:hypothetical protein
VIVVSTKCGGMILLVSTKCGGLIFDLSVGMIPEACSELMHSFTNVAHYALSHEEIDLVLQCLGWVKARQYWICNIYVVIIL